MDEDDVFGQVGSILADLNVLARVVIPGTVDHFFDVEPTHQDVFVFVEQPDVIDELESLETLFDGRHHVEHALLLFGREMEGVGDREMVIQMVMDAALKPPPVDTFDERTDT